MHKVLARLKTAAGFTLVELIIAIVIVVILTTIGVTSFNSAAKANAVQQQAQELKSLARKLRTDATAAVKPITGATTATSCKSVDPNPDAGTVYGTYITFQTGTANYTYGTACFDQTTPTTSYSSQTTATLPTGMTFTSASQTILYFFDGNVGALGSYGVPVAANFIPASYLSANYPLRISDGTLARDYRLSFSPSGLVCEEKWATNVCAN